MFHYDAGGKLIAEYSTVVETSNPQVSYLTNDHLGSPRITTDKNGKVYSRRDFLPFGKELTASHTQQRTGGVGYASDAVRQNFTGYERDNETELDFAQARMYQDKIGRFRSTDSLLSTGRPFNPSTWNRYSYTLNSPMNFIDPTGLYECTGTEQECTKFAEGLAKATEQLSKIKDFYGDESEEYIDAKRALDSYGIAGDKNGVMIGFGKLKGDVLGATLGTLKKTGKNTIDVTIDLEKNKSSGDLITTIAHEGSHVQDNSEYQSKLLSAYSSIEEADAVMNGPFRVTHEQSETRAYGVTSVFAQFTLGGGSDESAISSVGGTTTFKLNLPPIKSVTISGTNEKVWKSSWQRLDVQDIRN